MRTRTRLIGLVAAASFVAAGSVTAPAQAAPIVKPVTSGYVQMAFDAQLSTLLAATKPGRTAPNGLFFPITGMTKDAVVVAGELQDRGTSQSFPFRVDFNRKSGTGNISLTPGGVQPMTYFVFNNMKAGDPTLTINTKRKVRIVTTTWIGDLRLSDNPALASGINTRLGTSYSPLDKVGDIAIRVIVTTPCKIASCKR